LLRWASFSFAMSRRKILIGGAGMGAVASLPAVTTAATAVAVDGAPMPRRSEG